MNYPCVYTGEGARLSLEELCDVLRPLRQRGDRIITTNGCFDLLHAGHLEFLRQARALGDLLVVGLNSDRSVAGLKGPGRPLNPEADRAAMLLALRCVKYVLVFDDPLPTAWLQAVRPYRHCKAGDYTPESLPEAPAVRAGGGEIAILPLRPGISTSSLLGRLDGAGSRPVAPGSAEEQAMQLLLDGSNLLRRTAYRYAAQLAAAAARIAAALARGNKLLLCGNGGSAADAQHFAGEIVGRFLRERAGWPAIALTVDTSVLTCIANDYGYDRVFARQVEALGRAGDLLVAISTSGRSANVCAAAAQARAQGMAVIALTGPAPSPLAEISDLAFAIADAFTPHVQQAHLAIIHVLSQLVEERMTDPVPQEVAP